MSIYNNITELIGQTPIVKLNNIVPEGAADVYIKLEAFNPGSSVKDRIALSMIEKAEQDGILKPGSTIVEATSGNTGIGLSWVGAAKGYKVVIVMPETMSVERRKIIQAYGAERDGFLPLQFDNPANPEVHERTTGAEILAAFGKDGLDAFVAGVGTGGTISGVSHALKSENSNIQVFAVEADESAILSGEKPGPHKIQGISAGFIPDTLDTKAYDGIVRVTSDDALALGREIGGKEGFLVGISSAAAIYGAIEVAKKLGTGKKVLVLAPDNGERYLSTALYEL
ncbi:TPA: PLP-dependent cysteine synthase family protein [Streptococcus pneumoniae]